MPFERVSIDHLLKSPNPQLTKHAVAGPSVSNFLWFERQPGQIASIKKNLIKLSLSKVTLNVFKNASLPAFFLTRSEPGAHDIFVYAIAWFYLFL